ncbi:pre-mRNA-splicing factor prp46 [Gamsiella multidivaricata]|nr:pre-mRNA-splicing factor prp46 [Gamsiella multidivaricata]
MAGVMSQKGEVALWMGVPNITCKVSNKRKSTSVSPEDLYDNSTDTAAAPRKKKKKSKKERHDDRNDDHYDHRHNQDNGHARHDEALSPQQPLQKLPRIKISLRLPASPAIIPPSPPTHSGSGSSTKKKRRLSEQISIVSDDDEDEDQEETESYHHHQQSLGNNSEDDQELHSPSLHKKKKKHKHKHRHRHPKHGEQENRSHVQEEQGGQDKQEEQQEEQEEQELQEEEEVLSDVKDDQEDDADNETIAGLSTIIASEAKDDSAREGSAPAMTKSGRKGKALKRPSTPKSTIPTIPKKKELSVICNKLLDNFIRKDVYVLFTEPVDPILVSDYSTVIKNPMDFSTMRAKVERNFYPNIDEFLKDFQLVCDNARLYNAKDTLYWKQADKLWEWGSKAIERERKSVLDKDEEMLRTVKDEETVDVGGMGDYNNSSSTYAPVTSSRGPLLSTDTALDSPISFADSGRSHTPQQYRKTKKIKYRRDGTIAFSYATDGSIDPASHPDPWSLVPVVQDFGSAPLVCPLVETNPNYNGQYLDDYPYWKAPRTAFRSAVYQDYGPYAILGKPAPDMGGASGVQNIPAYTGMVFGDEKGEAYVRSLAMFLDGIVSESELATMSQDDAAGLLEIQEYVRKKVETLTRGASTIVDKVVAVVREERTGKASTIDTRVTTNLWRQELGDNDKFSNASTDGKELKESDEKTPTAQPSKALQMDDSQGDKDADMTDSDQSVRQENSTEVKMEDVQDSLNQKGAKSVDSTSQQDGASKDPVEEEERILNSSHGEVDMEMKEEKEEAPVSPSTSEWIDIRQVVRDIRAWPKILREKTDYESWRQLKIELDSLLLASQRSTPSIEAASADEMKVLWGKSWTGGNSEESKKWVREYLEQNSEDMKQVVRLLATKVPESKSAAILAATSMAPSPVPGSVTGSPTTSVTAAASTATTHAASATSDEQEKALLERLIASIRKRLVEMAQYVPLSEINPQRLPPPTAPPTSSAADQSQKDSSSTT